MEYKELKKNFYAFGDSNLENEYQTRLESFTTLLTDIISVLIQDKIFGSALSRISLPNLTEVLELSRHKVNKMVEKHNDKLNLLKQRPAVYELKDEFIEGLLSFNNEAEIEK